MLARWVLINALTGQVEIGPKPHAGYATYPRVENFPLEPRG
jgi:hypothetical protein